MINMIYDIKLTLEQIQTIFGHLQEGKWKVTNDTINTILTQKEQQDKELAEKNTVKKNKEIKEEK